MNILIVGDVYSKLGRSALERNLKKLREEHKINLVIVNGENTSHGKGLNENHYKWYMQQGVNVLTLGNHSFQNRNIFKFIDEVNNLVRPYNLPEGTKGKGYCTFNYNGIKITVFQMMGTVFMNNDSLRSTFEATEELLENVKSDIYICDFHGEATSEKIAYGLHFDGRVQVIYGTHTHVQTNDLRILPKGSAYVTDVGMTGALNGVIGTKASIIIDRFINKSQNVFEPEDKGPSQFNAILVEINDKEHKVTKVDMINVIE